MKNTMYDDPVCCPWCRGMSLEIAELCLMDDDSDEVLVYQGGDKSRSYVYDVKCFSCGEHFAIYKESMIW